MLAGLMSTISGTGESRRAQDLRGYLERHRFVPVQHASSDRGGGPPSSVGEQAEEAPGCPGVRGSTRAQASLAPACDWRTGLAPTHSHLLGNHAERGCVQRLLLSPFTALVRKLVPFQLNN